MLTLRCVLISVLGHVLGSVNLGWVLVNCHGLKTVAAYTTTSLYSLPCFTPLSSYVWSFLGCVFDRCRCEEQTAFPSSGRKRSNYSMHDALLVSSVCLQHSFPHRFPYDDRVVADHPTQWGYAPDSTVILLDTNRLKVHLITMNGILSIVVQWIGIRYRVNVMSGSSHSFTGT